MKIVEYYQVYAEHDDMTFIMRETASKEGIKKVRVVGFYYGKPTPANMELYKNKPCATLVNER